MWLLDLSPDPVRIGVAGLVILVIGVAIASVPLLIGFVFLLKLLKRRKQRGAQAQPANPNQ
jgi:hypothetical protein